MWQGHQNSKGNKAGGEQENDSPSENEREFLFKKDC